VKVVGIYFPAAFSFWRAGSDSDGLAIFGNAILVCLQAPDYAQLTFYNSNNTTLNAANRLGYMFYGMAESTLNIENAAGNKYLLLNPNTGGNVGIGTPTPGYSLDVQSSAQWAARFKKTGATHGGVLIESAAGYNPNIGLSVNGAIKWYINSNVANSDTLQFWESSGSYPRLTLTQAGNLGIGTGTPGYKLDVQAGQINASGGLCIAGDCKTGWSQVGGSQWTTSGSSIYYSGGNIGVGTSNPTSPLFISGNETSNDFATLRVKPTTTHGGVVIDSTNDASQVHLRFFKNGVPKWQFRVPFQSSEDLRIYSWSANADVVSINPAGDVGIGTTAPTVKLEVVGDVKVSGNIAARYQDVAGWVPAAAEIPPGTVVVVDTTKSNQVIPSTRAYDTRVAGVISERPGIALGERGTNKVLVATTGRVRVKVDATAGPIQIGDLLVTSNIPGLAMKSEAANLGGIEIHRPGTLIGKALEPLAKGSGEILVLLSLQ
jgi:hypothetical protein